MVIEISVLEQRQRLFPPPKDPQLPKAAIPTQARPDIEAHNLFTTIFGRDSLVMANNDLDNKPNVMEDVISFLASWQGVVDQTEPDAEGNWSEEEKGRILHEFRLPDDPRAQEFTKKRQWGWPYYGSVDSTLLFIKGIHDYCLLKGDNFLEKKVVDKNGNTKTIYDSLISAVNWTKNRMDRNPEGLIESKSPNPKGAQYQGWRDGSETYFDEKGSLAKPPVAPIEVQALLYDALLDTSELCAKKGLSSEAEDLKKRAAKVKQTIIDKFYIKDGGYFAMGSSRDENGQLKILKVKSSAMGWLLNSRILNEKSDEQYVQAIVKTLFAPDMLSIWGIRTISTESPRYSPVSYHNGSVWPMDNDWVAEGLWKHGFYQLGWQLKLRNVQIANLTGLMPENINGENSQIPVINTSKGLTKSKGGYETTFQEPQPIQGWTNTAVHKAKRQMVLLHQQKIPFYSLDPSKKEFETNILNQMEKKLTLKGNQII